MSFKYFLEFSELIFNELSDIVKYWCTINEPAVYVSQGYFNGVFPPGKKDPLLAGEVMKNQIDRSVLNGGIATRKLSTAEVRSKMRDPITSSNKQFVGTQISEGKLSGTYINAIPPAIGRTSKKGETTRRSQTPIGNTLNRRRFE